jgi:hypothetical protein
MGLLSGSISVTPCVVSARPDDPDFDRARFVALEPGASLRERAGFLPFEPGAPYRIGHTRWAFRLRVDRLRPDPAAVAERLTELLVGEREATGEGVVPARRRKRLRQQAEEELLGRATPRTKVVECVLDDQKLFIGTTANAWIGMVLERLRAVDVVAELTAPWLERQEGPLEDPLVEAREAWQSVRGCRFLKLLLGDPEVMVEPEAGGVRLATGQARVSLSGGVSVELAHFLEREVELLSAKLLVDDLAFRLDGLNWRLSGLRVDSERHDTWVDTLHERIGAVIEVFERLDGRYAALARQIGG